MRRLSADQRREELIAAAITVIARDGLAAATTRAIVAEAGMPLGAFHYVFASREELLERVIESVTDEERLAAWLGVDGGGDIRTVLAQGLDAYLRLLETDPSRELALLEVAVHAQRHNPEAARAQWRTYLRAMTASLEHAARLAGVTWNTPVDEVAHSFISALDGLTLTWLGDRDSVAARRHIDFLSAAFAALTLPSTEGSR
ncbi:TetR family transcriptional regulator [Microbacterium sp. AG790]|uniref:TetR/AcrR family transcriptional regulator n=1 Tax=Microbacterium sp. AG790 TaxID=2183995 RepID=UPI000EABF4FF|nr:TetR family transcriptional regulator [Microbacterium sp. AG790]RKS89954.1 TetR family transcriptional regulator [Microbacterium sp. AG790]